MKRGLAFVLVLLASIQALATPEGDVPLASTSPREETASPWREDAQLRGELAAVEAEIQAKEKGWPEWTKLTAGAGLVVAGATLWVGTMSTAASLAFFPGATAAVATGRTVPDAPPPLNTGLLVSVIGASLGVSLASAIYGQRVAYVHEREREELAKKAAALEAERLGVWQKTRNTREEEVASWSEVLKESEARAPDVSEEPTRRPLVPHPAAP